MPDEPFKLLESGIWMTIFIVGGIALIVFVRRAIRLAGEDGRVDAKQLWRITLLRMLLAVSVLSMLASPLWWLAISFGNNERLISLYVLNWPVFDILFGVMFLGFLGQFVSGLAFTGMFFLMDMPLIRDTWQSFSLLRGIGIRCRALRLRLKRNSTIIRILSLVVAGRSSIQKHDRRLW